MNQPFPPPDAPGPPGPPGPPPGAVPGAPPGFPPAPGYPPGPPPAQPTKRSGAKGCLIAAGVVGLLVVALGVFGAVRLAGFVNEQASTHIDRATVGDCVRDTGETTSPVRITPCPDAASTHTVLALQSTGSGEDCIDVPGAVRQVSNDDGRVCLGLKGVDPTRSANAAQVGDCLAVTGNDAETVPCDDPTAEHKVLSREKVSGVLGAGPFPCQDVEGAERSYTISWEGDPLSTLGSKGLSFCLGPNG